VQRCVQESFVRAHSSVLWLQGETACVQPLNTERQMLMWNGDVYRYDDCPLPSQVSDTAFLSDKLAACQTDEDMLHTISKVRGPWAFVFWDKVRNCLWYGRDFFGRQSLLIHKEDNNLILTSCAPKTEEFCFAEVTANGIYKQDLALPLRRPILFPWDIIESLSDDNSKDIEVSTKLISCPVRLICDNRAAQKEDYELSTIILEHSTECKEKPDISDPQEEASIFPSMLDNPKVLEKVEELISRLEAAVQTRIDLQPGRCKICIDDGGDCVDCCVGVLFSGGLDSAVLALIAAKLLATGSGKTRKLDLMNVAFPLADGSFDVPDRITGRQALQEIRDIVGDCVEVRMVEINITKDELQTLRHQSISNLLYPLQTVLDDGIGCAIWFAARGAGLVDGQPYQSPCRVLLSGMGIDEQLGGYARHRGRYAKGGLSGLEEELRMEILRISERNLGRDNRIISDHGVMARFPFLDEDLVTFLSSLHTRLKADLSLPRGIGEKLVLRLAAWNLGLLKTSREPKRAVQFGSRIAKLENKKEKASDVAVRI